MFLRMAFLRIFLPLVLTSCLLNFDREKEREHENLDAAYTEATKNLQQVETTLTNMKAQLKLKKEEVQSLCCSLLCHLTFDDR